MRIAQWPAKRTASSLIVVNPGHPGRHGRRNRELDMKTIPLTKLSEETLRDACSIAVDVDGTLLLWEGEDPGIPGNGTPQPNAVLIETLRGWKRSDPARELTVWSGMGRVHAAKAVAFLGIEDIADHIMAKPSVMFDDAPGWFDSQTMVDVRQ